MSRSQEIEELDMCVRPCVEIDSPPLDSFGEKIKVTPLINYFIYLGEDISLGTWLERGIFHLKTHLHHLQRNAQMQGQCY